jgi:hypothetical protein
MSAPELMRSQRNDVLKATQAAGFDKKEFEWEMAGVGPYRPPAPQLVHKPTGYFFQFDYVEGDFTHPSSRVARFAPGSEHPKEASRCRSWQDMLHALSRWLGYIRRETEEEDLWEKEEYEKFQSWISPNSKFTPTELHSIDVGLDRVEKLLVSHSDKAERTLVDISDNIKYLKSTAKKSGRRDWLMMFIGVVISKLADWGIANLPWQLIATELLKNIKGLLPGK